jgi:hypothetical protein
MLISTDEMPTVVFARTPNDGQLGIPYRLQREQKSEKCPPPLTLLSANIAFPSGLETEFTDNLFVQLQTCESEVTSFEFQDEDNKPVFLAASNEIEWNITNPSIITHVAFKPRLKLFTPLMRWVPALLLWHWNPEMSEWLRVYEKCPFTLAMSPVILKGAADTEIPVVFFNAHTAEGRRMAAAARKNKNDGAGSSTQRVRVDEAAEGVDAVAAPPHDAIQELADVPPLSDLPAMLAAHLRVPFWAPLERTGEFKLPRICGHSTVQLLSPLPGDLTTDLIFGGIVEREENKFEATDEVWLNRIVVRNGRLTSLLQPLRFADAGLAERPSARAGACMAALPDDVFLLWGGGQANFETRESICFPTEWVEGRGFECVDSDVWLLKLNRGLDSEVTGVWTRLKPAGESNEPPAARALACVAVISDWDMMIFGGEARALSARRQTFFTKFYKDALHLHIDFEGLCYSWRPISYLEALPGLSSAHGFSNATCVVSSARTSIAIIGGLRCIEQDDEEGQDEFWCASGAVIRLTVALEDGLVRVMNTQSHSTVSCIIGARALSFHADLLWCAYVFGGAEYCYARGDEDCTSQLVDENQLLCGALVSPDGTLETLEHAVTHTLPCIAANPFARNRVMHTTTPLELSDGRRYMIVTGGMIRNDQHFFIMTNNVCLIRVR